MSKRQAPNPSILSKGGALKVYEGDWSEREPWPTSHVKIGASA
jgi:hypothetical protein